MNLKDHWENVYSAMDATEASWFQDHPTASLEIIERLGLCKSSPIVDVGGGASHLVDDLLAEGCSDLTVLDLSSSALAQARKRLGPAASKVNWIEADVTEAPFPNHKFAVWHDRAVFHFLTDAADRRSYIEQMRWAVRPGGYVIIAAFAPNGPSECSGLPVMRYSCRTLEVEFGVDFDLVERAAETHRTPFDTEQQFVYCRFRKST